jgi:hypothetical protein
MQFDEKQSTQLCEIMGRNKSDKGNINITKSWHNYTTFYYSIFKDLSNNNLRIFELGLGTNNVNLPSNMGANGRPGASLYGWQEFFPNSKIFGADVDKDILFNTERIKTYFCDQTNPEIIKQMWNVSDLQENFDIIIEDGLHTFNANVCFFENSIHKLNPNGYFIIEDICNNDIGLFVNKINEWETKYTDCTFTLLKIPSLCNFLDNTLLVVFRNNNKSIFTYDLTNNLKVSLRELYHNKPVEQLLCVEIGSFEGRGSIVIHNYLCNNTNSKLYCIDPFDDEYVKGSSTMSFWNSACKGQKARFYNNTQDYTKIIPMQGYSDEMILKLEDKTIDFAYIDGDHSAEQVYKDAVAIFPKMKHNSILLFDDYEWVKNGHITKNGIDKFLNEYSDKYILLFKNLQLAIRIV